MCYSVLKLFPSCFHCLPSWDIRTVGNSQGHALVNILSGWGMHGGSIRTSAWAFLRDPPSGTRIPCSFRAKCGSLSASATIGFLLSCLSPFMQGHAACPTHSRRMKEHLFYTSEQVLFQRSRDEWSRRVTGHPAGTAAQEVCQGFVEVLHSCN